jgi:nucleoside-diphosphate-sugar epimerase
VTTPRARIAVTGANGYLGKQLAAFLRLKDRDVVGLVRSAHAALTVVECGAHPEIVAALDPRLMARAVRGCSAIIHLAGISAERGDATYGAVNVGGMRSVIRAARESGVERIVFLSGLGVARYGAGRRTTNGYFRSKKAAEELLEESDRTAVIFRPSYIVGPHDELIPALLREMEQGAVEVVGDGRYRLQPVAIGDAVAAMLKAAEAPLPRFSVFDLVGPEPLTYRQFVARVATAARAADRSSVFNIRETPIEIAEQKARKGGYRGLLPDELDVLLCDEIADHVPLERLLGRKLMSLNDALAAAIAGSQARPSASFRRHA